MFCAVTDADLHEAMYYFFRGALIEASATNSYKSASKARSAKMSNQLLSPLITRTSLIIRNTNKHRERPAELLPTKAW